MHSTRAVSLSESEFAGLEDLQETSLISQFSQ